jgi:antitoxin ParD1/3/4
MPTRNVHLTEHYDSFIAAGIEEGRYSNASEAVRAGLRLLEQREQEDRAKLEWLRAAAKEGFDALDRGDFTTLNSEAEMTSFFQEIHEEVKAELTAARV